MKWIINNSKYGIYGQLSEYEGVEIDLLTLKELHEIQLHSPNTILVNIFGEEILAKDANDDIRSGYTALTRKDSIR